MADEGRAYYVKAQPAGVNVRRLYEELRGALGERVGSVAVTGDGLLAMLDLDATPEDEAQVEAVVAAHDPAQPSAQDLIDARRAAAAAAFASVPQLARVTPAQAEAYIRNNVNDLASARDALVLMARCILALRDALWPHLQD